MKKLCFVFLLFVAHEVFGQAASLCGFYSGVAGGDTSKWAFHVTLSLTSDSAFTMAVSTKNCDNGPFSMKGKWIYKDGLILLKPDEGSYLSCVDSTIKSGKNRRLQKKGYYPIRLNKNDAGKSSMGFFIHVNYDCWEMMWYEHMIVNVIKEN